MFCSFIAFEMYWAFCRILQRYCLTDRLILESYFTHSDDVVIARLLTSNSHQKYYTWSESLTRLSLMISVIRLNATPCHTSPACRVKFHDRLARQSRPPCPRRQSLLITSFGTSSQVDEDNLYLQTHAATLGAPAPLLCSDSSSCRKRSQQSTTWRQGLAIVGERQCNPQ